MFELLPPYNPPGWTYSEGGLWPQYYYLYNDLLGLPEPLTFYLRTSFEHFPAQWYVGGLTLLLVMAILALAFYCGRRWSIAWMFPFAGLFTLVGHVLVK